LWLLSSCSSFSAPTSERTASVKRFVSLQFIDPKTVGRSPWTGDKPIAKPLISIYTVLIACTLCSFYNWPCSCWLATNATKNWIQLSSFILRTNTWYTQRFAAGISSFFRTQFTFSKQWSLHLEMCTASGMLTSCNRLHVEEPTAEGSLSCSQDPVIRLYPQSGGSTPQLPILLIRSF
jgi:hypothetical protein